MLDFEPILIGTKNIFSFINLFSLFRNTVTYNCSCRIPKNLKVDLTGEHETMEEMFGTIKNRNDLVRRLTENNTLLFFFFLLLVFHVFFFFSLFIFPSFSSNHFFFHLFFLILFSFIFLFLFLFLFYAFFLFLYFLLFLPTILSWISSYYYHFLFFFLLWSGWSPFSSQDGLVCRLFTTVFAQECFCKQKTTQVIYISLLTKLCTIFSPE